jgi:hypothetical protein
MTKIMKQIAEENGYLNMNPVMLAKVVIPIENHVSSLLKIYRETAAH